MMESNKCTLHVQSEIGTLEAVLIHYPGPEVENMTPRNAQRALYSDILNLSIARKEYDQLTGVLQQTTQVYEVSDLLTELLLREELKEELIRNICEKEQVRGYIYYLMDLPANVLSKILIEGLPIQINTLTDYLR